MEKITNVSHKWICKKCTRDFTSPSSAEKHLDEHKEKDN